LNSAALQVARASRWGLAAILLVVLVGAALRLAWNDVSEYSRADETVYLSYARSVSQDPASYPQIVRAYIADPNSWVFPLPSRFAGIAITSAACVLAPCTHRTLAWLETLAGIAAIVMTYLVARNLFGETTAILAAGLTATCPIQLGMGRRALEDELLLLTILGALWATVRIAQATMVPKRSVVVGVAAFTLALATKETFLLYYPALAAVLLILKRTRLRLADALLFALPPVLFAGVFGLLTRDPFALVTLAGIQQAGRSMPYILEFQSGPVWEPFVDIYILAPLVSIAALISMGIALASPAQRRRPAAALCAYVALLFAAYAFIPKDARYFMPADAGMRMLAAWGVVSAASLLGPVAPLLIAGGGIVNAIVELLIFDAVFLRGNVYDPVLANLLRALDAIPR
jgi:Dolichyl-phosphate-mannose-protein mannosyltransferase